MSVSRTPAQRTSRRLGAAASAQMRRKRRNGNCVRRDDDHRDGGKADGETNVGGLDGFQSKERVIGFRGK